MKAVLLTLIVASCTSERSVLIYSNQCELALTTGARGESCNFTETCLLSDPDNAACNNHVACIDGRLVFTQTCMTTCTDDTDCVHGTEICIGTTCEACPDTSSCAACPVGFLPLERNGCPSCDCAPAPTCIAGAASPCSLNEECYAGADCAVGCADGDVGCCSDQCAAKGCKAPIPTGCLVQCSTGTQAACGGACITNNCECVAGGVWQCTSVCAHGAQSTCVGPT